MSNKLWRDDDGTEIKVVSAEQHALDNPTHVVTVTARSAQDEDVVQLRLTCASCDWWDEQLL